MVAARTGAWCLVHTHPEDLPSGRHGSVRAQRTQVARERPEKPVLLRRARRIAHARLGARPAQPLRGAADGRFIVPVDKSPANATLRAGTNPERLSGETRARATGGGGLRRGRFT